MSDNEDKSVEEEKPFFADRAKTGRAGCKKCKSKIDSHTLRIAKMTSNPFGSGKLKVWHHVNCLFEAFEKQRATTARINTSDDIGGWDNLSEEDHEEILSFIQKAPKRKPTNTPEKQHLKTPVKKPKKTADQHSPSSVQTIRNKTNTSKVNTVSSEKTSTNHKDNLFREFRRLCAEVANEPSYTGKTALIKQLFTKGTDGTGFQGDLFLWCSLLLPGAVKRVYNLQSKQLIKLFSRIFHTDHDEMLVDLEQGDVAETIRIFFEKGTLKPSKKSLLTLQDVNEFLLKLSKMTKEDEQMNHFENIAKMCSSNDLKMIIRLVKHDLRINAGPKHILEAVHQDAYAAFQASCDLGAVLSRVVGQSSAGVLSKDQESIDITVSLMTPIQPMLAEPCKAIESALKKCPNGMYSEVKYDGERVQLHKQGTNFKYYSRSLKPVMAHKVAHFKEFIPKAFPHAKDLILDTEVILVDTTNGKPLPFGTLGIHKKTAFKDASVCLFVFDCIYYNGKLLIDRPLQERRQILENNMKEIKNHVMFSEVKILHTAKELESMITDVFRLGLEGLVLKDLKSIYEPGKRHWLKVKKDYLFGGAMADSVDMVVLGAWFGTGAKGGMMSSFLMGVLDTRNNKWCTVTKVHGGHDEATLQSLQKELDMIKISKDESLMPGWLNATKTMVPDFVARDPCNMPVWEVTGAEFTQHKVHTANGISIRFPRVTKIRSDKDWHTANTLEELSELYKKSKQSADFVLPEVSSISSAEENKCRSPSNSSPLKDKVKENKLVQHKLCFDNTSSKKCEKNEKNRDKHSASDEITNELPMKRRKVHTKHKLPNVFQGIKLVLPRAAENRKSLERYFVAFGGTSLQTSDIQESTHVIYFNNVCEKQIWPKLAIHVDINWLWDSIKLKCLQEIKLYLVKTVVQ